MIRFSLFLVLLASPVFSQPSDYWQQHVSYQIEAALIDSIHSYNGKLSVAYTNNSPETLNEVYFHLYFNAFRPGSMMYERSKAQNDQGMMGKFNRYKQSDWGGYNILGVRAGGVAKYEVTGTIMKVTLNQPLAPKQTQTIELDFFAQIPKQTRRSGWMNDHGIKYSMCQWYPKVCEYDREGWHHQEYVGREFYGVWGEFDVKLTVPASYCVGATGEVQNPNEVGWGYDSIAKGSKKGIYYPTKQDGMKTWRFKASNVHDFAWVADEYIHEWDTWSDTVSVHCLYKLGDRESWKEAMKHTIFMLDHHSKAVGWYQYRNFYNTHAGDGGMEYPQLIMDGSPNAGLIMHEGAHQWFYGMLGNNETRYAFLDEGFTEFLEMVVMEAYYGRHNERAPYRDTSWLTRTFIPEFDHRKNYYGPYQNLATLGYEEPLNIPHDWARENPNAGQAYFKTLNGLAQLEYVLGDDVFWKGMKEYFRRWHFKHPNLNDFKRTMEDVSGADLDWYFDQWFHTTRTIDYGVYDVESALTGDRTYGTTVELYNCDVGVMPIDLLLHYEDGTTGLATIPLAVNQGTAYRKPEPGRIFFTPWDWVKKEYKGTAITPKEVDWVEIDTSFRLQDLNYSNNRTYHFSFLDPFENPPNEIAFLKQLHANPPYTKGYAVIRPIIWFDEVSNLNLGVGILKGFRNLGNEDWMFNFLFDAENLNERFEQRTVDRANGPLELKEPLMDRVDFRYRGTYNVKWLGDLTTFGLLVKKQAGIYDLGAQIDHTIRPTYLSLGPTHKVNASLNLFERINYAYFRGEWEAGPTIAVAGKYSFTSTNRRTDVQLGGKVYLHSMNNRNFFSTDVDISGFDKLWANVTQQIPLASGIGLDLRANFGAMSGVPPTQIYQRIGSADPYESQHQDFYRAIALINNHFTKEAHFFVEGGAGMRGYAMNPTPANTYASLNIDLKVALFQAVGVGLFADLGSYTSNAYQLFSQFQKNARADAGVSIKLDLLSFLPWQLQGVAEEYGSIPSINFYFPFFLNRPYDGKEHFAFRYAIGLGSTF